MKTVILMRHAKSSWKNPNLVDHDRPLNKRGKRDAPRMGTLLNEENFVPEAIFCSTAERAKLTVVGLLETCSFNGEIIYDRSLYHGGPEDFYGILEDLSTHIQRVMLVGHNPGMEYFLDLTTDSPDNMPTGAIAVISFPIKSWSEINDEVEGQLLHLWKPRELAQM